MRAWTFWQFPQEQAEVSGLPPQADDRQPHPVPAAPFRGRRRPAAAQNHARRPPGPCHPRQEKAKGGSCCPPGGASEAYAASAYLGRPAPGVGRSPGRLRPLWRGRGRPRPITGRQTARRLRTRAGGNAENRQVHTEDLQTPRTPGLSPIKRTGWHSSCLAWPSLHSRPRPWGTPPPGCLPGSTGSLGLGKPRNS